MSIEALVEDSLGLLQKSRFDASMSLACACLDATATKEFGEKVGYRWKMFTRSRMDIISSVGFGGALLVAPGVNLNIKNPAKPSETVPFESVIYKTIRCFLVHGASLPPGVEFTPDAFYGERNGIFHIPSNMILALVLAVVSSPSNAGRVMGIDFQITLSGKKIGINKLWGKTSELRGAISANPVSTGAQP